MKRTLALLTACTLALSLLSGCGLAAADYQELTAEAVYAANYDGPPQLAQSVDQAASSLGLDLLRTARAEGEATLLSPLSILLALSMAANGADGDTLAQFEAVLSGGAGLDVLNAVCQDLTQAYEELGGSTRCSIANSLWVDPEGQIREDFIGRCIGTFDAQVLSAQLSDPGIVPALNGWVSDHTNGMIPSIIDRPFPEESAALLVNALYLKNTWETEFDPDSTWERAFRHAGAEDEWMDFLCHYQLSFPYLQGWDSVGALLPYGDGRLAFFALMPEDSRADFGEWLEGLSGEELSQLLRSAGEQEESLFLRLSLPKFEAEWRGELRDMLSSLGLDLAFTPIAADFSRMGDNPDGYFLSQVIHAAKIEVNEKGTEAAAATVVDAVGGSSESEKPQGIQLDFNRPFLYGIADRQTGVPLFLGTFE